METAWAEGGRRREVRARAGISCTILQSIAGALLAVPALRRVACLASLPAMAAKLHNLFLREPLEELCGVIRHLRTQLSAVDQFFIMADAVAAIFLRVIQRLVRVAQDHYR